MIRPGLLPQVLLWGGCASGDDTAAPSDTGEDHTWDVLVVGAGPAGLAAALEARDRGASVRVLEREAHTGGAFWYAGSHILLSGTSEQAAAGIEDSPAILLSEWRDFTGGDPEAPWVRAFAQRNVPDVRDWLVVRAGAVFQLSGVPDASSGPTRRTHETTGRGMDVTDALEQALGSDTIAFSTTVDGFVRDDSGAVIGLTWHRTGDPATRGRIAGTRTVVATGGFQRDLDHVRALRPDLASVDLLHASTPGTDGNGHALLESLGASWVNPAAIGLYLHGTPDPAAPGEELTPSFTNAGIWVDAEGRRFTDENVYNSLSVADVALARAGGVVWLVVHGPLVQDSSFSDPMVLEGEPGSATVLDVLAGGFVYASDTVAGLAESIGADDAVLQATVDAFNAWVYGKAPDAFRHGSSRPPPIETPPFYAVRIVPSVAKAFGGIAVDEDGRVTDADGDPLPGVLAAGELTGMAGGSLVGDRGFTGSISAVLLSGRIAGASAAAEALGIE